MNVTEILDIAKQVQTKWSTRIIPRTNEEGQLKAHLGSTISYAILSAEFSRWVTILSGLSSKPRVSPIISKQLLMTLSASLSGLIKAIDHSDNGVEWICTNKNFGIYFVLTTNLIRELSLDTAREVKAITNAAQERLSKDLGTLQTATEQADKFVLDWPEIETKISALDDAQEATGQIVRKLSESATNAEAEIAAKQQSVTKASETSRTEIDAATSTFNESLTVANQTLAEADKLHVEAQKIRGETQSTAAKARTDLESSNTALKAAIEQQELTQKRLSKALQNAQMEGLAGSFTQMKVATEAVIKTEQTRFDRALTYLVVIAVLGFGIEAYLGFPKTTLEEFGIRMFKLLSLAAPGIWIAWATSKKLNALNRVFSDYEYKSAAALAYESYRQTVAEAGSDELKQQLLAFAIRSFGENPTHYYESAKNEASSPFESVMQAMPFFSKNKSDPPKSS